MKNIGPLLEMIRNLEGRNSYDTWNDQTKFRGNKPLTQMTVAEVLAQQRENFKLPKAQQFTAAGVYQMTYRTLLEEVNKVTSGVKQSDLFNQETQDKLALSRLKYRGLDKWDMGLISDEKFGNNVAMEWAALPVLQDTYRIYKGKRTFVPKGTGYYNGVGSNKEGTSVSAFLGAIQGNGQPFQKTESPHNENKIKTALSPQGEPEISSQSNKLASGYGQVVEDNTDKTARQYSTNRYLPTDKVETNVVKPVPYSAPSYDDSKKLLLKEAAEGNRIDPDYKRIEGEGGGAQASSGRLSAFNDEFYDSLLTNLITGPKASNYDLDPKFDPIQTAIDRGHTKYAGFLNQARNEEHYTALEEVIAEGIAKNRRRAVSNHTASAFMGGMANPDSLATMLLPAGMIVSASMKTGVNAARSFVGGSAIGLATETAIELNRADTDPMSTPEESMLRIGATTLFSGMLVGTIGGLVARNMRKNLLDDMMMEIAATKPNTSVFDAGNGQSLVVRMVQTNDQIDWSKSPSGVYRMGDELVVNEQILSARVKAKQALPKLFGDEVSYNELLEYELAKAASIHRKTRAARTVSEVKRPRGISKQRYAKLEEYAETAANSNNAAGQIRGSLQAKKGKKAEKELDIFNRLLANKKAEQLNQKTAARKAQEAEDLKSAQANTKDPSNARVYDRKGMNTAPYHKQVSDDLDELPFDDAQRISREAEEDAVTAAERYRQENNKILSSPNMEMLGKLVDSPYKYIHRMSLHPDVRDLADILASDGGLLRASDGSGQNIGTSVYSGKRVWTGYIDTMLRKETELYERYLGYDSNPAIANVPLNKSLRTARANGQRAMSMEEWRDATSKALITGEVSPISEINEMVEVLRGTYKTFGDAAEEHGIITTKANLAAQIRNIDQQIAELDPDNFVEMPDQHVFHANVSEIDRLGQIRERAQRALDDADFEPDGDYFTRVYSINKIQQNREAFKRQVVMPFMRQQPMIQIWQEGQMEIGKLLDEALAELDRITVRQADNTNPDLNRTFSRARNAASDKVNKLNQRIQKAPEESRFEWIKADVTEEAVSKRADDLIDTILQEAEPADMATYRDPNRPSFGRHRQFNIPNSYLLKDGPNGNGIDDFISTDYAIIMNLYSERMGPAIEMSKRFARPADGVSWVKGFEEAMNKLRNSELGKWANENVSFPQTNARIVKGFTNSRTADGRYMPAFYRRDEGPNGTIYIDEDFFARSYNDKPWLNPRVEGVRPLPDGVIRSPQDWINFVKIHEIMHTLKKAEDLGYSRPLSPEHKAAYENDINDLALDWFSRFSSEDGFGKHWSEIEMRLGHLRDRATNQVRRDPNRWDNRTASVLRDWSHLVFMGKSALSAITEFGMLTMTHGMQKTFRAAFGSMDADLNAVMSAGVFEGRKTGAVMDIHYGAALSNFAETGFEAAKVSEAERLLRIGANKFFLFNGLAPLTSVMKEMDLSLRVTDMLDRIKRVEAGLATRADHKYLDRFGISKRDAERMAQEPIQMRGDAGWLANTDMWSDTDLVHKFRAAIAQGNENTILAATAADKPIISDGVVYLRKNPTLDGLAEQMGFEDAGEFYKLESGMLSLPFTFWNYAMAASNKILLAGLDEPSSRKLGGIAAITGLAYMVQAIKTPSETWDKLDAGAKLQRTINQSGILGVLPEYNDLVQGTAIGLTGVNPMPWEPKYGYYPSATDALFNAMGAGPSVLKNAVEGITTGDADSLRWATPLANYYGIGQFLEYAYDGMERNGAR